MFFILSLLLLAATTIASPTPVADPDPPTLTAQTAFTQYVSCSQDEVNILNQNVKDAAALANTGLDYINDDLTTGTYPQYGHQQVDFSKQAAIDFFGPESQNGPYQQRIFDTMLKASNAYPGWGYSDWWKDRYVALSCIEAPNTKSCDGTTPAYFSHRHDYGYPLVVFCPEFFNVLRSHADVVKDVDQNKDLQQNVANLRSRATTFLHELLHINWGTAQECAGESACLDHFQIIGNKPVLSYKTGRTKLLAQRNVKQAAVNNDNYAYYSMVKFMEKRYKQYPKYPAAWDPTKSRSENEDREKKEPGTPPNVALDELEGNDVDGDTGGGTPVSDNKYPSSAYPDWYQDLVNASFDDDVPDLAQPTTNDLTYNGPDMSAVICETSDGSPDMEDCVNAFGTLKIAATMGPLQGKKGGNWWAAYVNDCALSISYDQDWNDDCKATMKDVDDHASAIFEGCQDPGNGKVGGRVAFGPPNCPGQIEIIHTGGEPPQGQR
ncbi:MAG: hypothetical protein M4579_007031 [Chaenotheca gracillima]|nr:MAG: hypothetical protein M4579_007031 [Chaenotheca gracillima]